MSFALASARRAPHRGAARAAALVGLSAAVAVLVPAPAQAAEGSSLIGHRCRTYDDSVTKENTVAALAEVSKVGGVSCEVDMWRIADGRQIIWHDPTWERVADPATLPDGIEPTDRVVDATWDQVQQIRTRGGEPVARFRPFAAASAEYGVPIIVEVHNAVSNPLEMVAWADELGASVRYYQAPNPACETTALDRMRAAGAPVGLKLSDDAPCQLTPDEVADRGSSFVTEAAVQITPANIRALNSRGVEVYGRWGNSETLKGLLGIGAAKVMVNNPNDALAWLS